MTRTWPWQKPPAQEPTINTSPELEYVRALAQRAADLAEEVEQELADHKQEGHTAP